MRLHRLPTSSPCLTYCHNMTGRAFSRRPALEHNTQWESLALYHDLDHLAMTFSLSYEVVCAGSQTRQVDDGSP